MTARLPKNWLKGQLRRAADEVRSWPQWMQDATKFPDDEEVSTPRRAGTMKRRVTVMRWEPRKLTINTRTGERIVDAWCYGPLALHVDLMCPDQWQVTHIASTFRVSISGFEATDWPTLAAWCEHVADLPEWDQVSGRFDDNMKEIIEGPIDALRARIRERGVPQAHEADVL